MLGYAQLLRPRNCLVAILGVLVIILIGYSDTGLESLPKLTMAMAVLTVFFFMGASNTLNDYLDRDIDRINHPERPIPSSRANAGVAKAVTGIFFALAIISSIFLNYYCIILVFVNLALMLGYEFRTKNMGLLGNVMISWLTASLFLFGGFGIYDERSDILRITFILMFLSFFATLGREIIKDIEDMKGDIGRRTLPMKLGAKKAGYFVLGCYATSIAISPLPYILGIFGPEYLAAVILADVMFIYGFMIIMAKPKRAQQISVLAMLVALLAFLVGGIMPLL
jgi:geranylgeranylglycerol-phosphate geranylgeranyltransferase